MGAMETWYPPKDRPQLLEWWRPLILASRAARLAQFPWPINIDEMILVGRIDRGARPAIWVYRNPEAGGEIYLDSTGQPYKFTRTPKAKGYGRFTSCDIRTALWRSGLPKVVEPVWYEPPPVPAGHGWSSEAPPDDDEAEPEDGAETTSHAPPAPRRRGHLTVHDGGRPLAG